MCCCFFLNCYFNIKFKKYIDRDNLVKQKSELITPTYINYLNQL